MLTYVYCINFLTDQFDVHAFERYFKIKSNLAEAYVYCTNKMYLINVENLFYSKKINHHLTNNN